MIKDKARKLFIGIDARVLFMPMMKGMGFYLQNLLENFITLDKENSYILYYDTRQNVKLRTLNSPNFSVKGISIRSGDSFHSWEQVRLPIELSRDKIDILHSPANTSIFASRCPRICTVHDTILQELEKKGFDNFYFNRFIPFSLRRAKKIITCSIYSKQKINKLLNIPEEKIEVIPNGVSSIFKKINDKEAISKVKRKYAIEGEYIFNVGGESPWKNVSNLILAYKLLVSKSSIKQKIVIAGIRTKSIAENHLKEIAELGLSDRAIILGYVSEQELVHLYNGAEIFVYPSLNEGFGLPPLEAMACGIPVVASNKASIPEVVGDAAILVDATNESAIAKGIGLILNNAALKDKLRDLGTKRCSRFTWQQTAKKTLQLYINSCSNKNMKS